MSYRWIPICCGTIQSAAIKGHVACLKYLWEITSFHPNIWYSCVFGKNIECVEFIRNKQQIPHHICLTEYATKDVNMLRYLYENNLYEWSESVCNTAVLYNTLNSLVFAHENGCPWDSRVCVLASVYGYIDILMYAHENGCPWNSNVITNSAHNGHIDCLKYAVENGCPKDTYVSLFRPILYTKLEDDPDELETMQCLQYLIEHDIGINEETNEIIQAENRSNEIAKDFIFEKFGCDIGRVIMNMLKMEKMIDLYVPSISEKFEYQSRGKEWRTW
jgi:hypothetical protein